MRTTGDHAFRALAWTAGLAVPAGLAGLVAFVAFRGAPHLLTAGALAQMWPATAGTLLLVAGACALALPVGVGAGVRLSQHRGGRAERALRTLVEVLASVPSVLLGLLGYGAILLLRRTVAPDAHTGLVVAAACLAVLVLPGVVVATSAALDGIPERIRLLGPSLGLSPEQSVRAILLPAAGRGILAGAVLAVGRAAEDMAVILLAGVVANGGVPTSPADRFEALPFRVFYLTAEHRTPADLDAAFGTALVLLAVAAAISVSAGVLERGLRGRWETGP